jgi:hypothetical protein
MPNLCLNHLTITGPEADVKAFVDGAEGKQCLVDAYHPMPEELRGTTHGYPADPDEVREVMLAKYGAPDWYEWANKNWGTKWGDYDTDLLTAQPGFAQYVYTTAWGPMAAAVRAFSAKFPTLDFTCSYEEAGCELLGAFRCVNGDIVAESAIGQDEWPELVEDENGDYDYDAHEEALSNLRDRVISDLADEVVVLVHP